MDFIIDILLDFFRALGLPYRTVNVLFKDYRSIYGSAKDLSNSELQILKDSTALTGELNRVAKRYAHLLFVPKKTARGKIGWNVIGLNKSQRNVFEFSLFCDDAANMSEFKNIALRCSISNQ